MDGRTGGESKVLHEVLADLKRVSSFISRRSGLTINDDNVDKVQALQKLQIFLAKFGWMGKCFRANRYFTMNYRNLAIV